MSSGSRSHECRRSSQTDLVGAGKDVMGVLIARATGMSIGDALRERICEPLGMNDTAFTVGGDSISRLATAYRYGKSEPPGAKR